MVKIELRSLSEPEFRSPKSLLVRRNGSGQTKRTAIWESKEPSSGLTLNRGILRPGLARSLDGPPRSQAGGIFQTQILRLATRC